jgi:integrase
MTPERIATAAEAYKLTDEIGVDLLVAVREYAATRKARSASIPFVELFDAFIEVKSELSSDYLKELRITRDRMPQLHARMVSDITYRDLGPILDKMPPASRNAVMRYLRAVFFYGVKRGFMAENPILRLDFVKRARGEVVTVPVNQVEAMPNHALDNDLALLPYLVFGFFCGIRPDRELQELEWSDVDLNGGSVTIRAEVSKTNRRRFVDLSANAQAWLNDAARGGAFTGRISPFNHSQMRKQRTTNRKAAGVEKWPQQGMRHTFCSNWLAMHQDVNRLVLPSGHDSVDTMWRSFHKGVQKSEAEKFWSNMPPIEPANVGSR